MSKYFAIVAVMLLVAGCNTVQGIGKDIKQGGAAIEKASRN